MGMKKPNKKITTSFLLLFMCRTDVNSYWD